jgi:hypothetical protein
VTDYVTAAAFFVFALVLLHGFGWMLRVRGARFGVTEGPSGYLATELGRFRFDKGRGVLLVRYRAGKGFCEQQEVSFQRPPRFVDVTETRSALLKELLTFDMSTLDLLPAFRDQDFTTVLALTDGERTVPMACLRQYRRFEALMYQHEMLVAYYRGIGMYDDIQNVVMKLKGEFGEALGDQGLRVSWE